MQLVARGKPGIHGGRGRMPSSPDLALPAARIAAASWPMAISMAHYRGRGVAVNLTAGSVALPPPGAGAWKSI